MNDADVTGEDKPADGDALWYVGPVSGAEWHDLGQRLRRSYHRGEIRQGLGVLRG
jgi:hypothetical protein